MIVPPPLGSGTGVGLLALPVAGGTGKVTDLVRGHGTCDDPVTIELKFIRWHSDALRADAQKASDIHFDGLDTPVGTLLRVFNRRDFIAVTVIELLADDLIALHGCESLLGAGLLTRLSLLRLSILFPLNRDVRLPLLLDIDLRLALLRDMNARLRLLNLYFWFRLSDRDLGLRLGDRHLGLGLLNVDCRLLLMNGHIWLVLLDLDLRPLATRRGGCATTPVRRGRKATGSVKDSLMPGHPSTCP